MSIEPALSGALVRWNNRKNSPSYLVAENGCHLWLGATDRQGYGRAWDTATKRHGLVYRIRYEREVGPVPVGMELDHFACDNPQCCNPAHVRPVATRENQLRGNSASARNAAKTHCPKGHPLSGENLVESYLRRTGRRKCVICERERARKRGRDLHGRITWDMVDALRDTMIVPRIDLSAEDDTAALQLAIDQAASLHALAGLLASLLPPRGHKP